MPTTNLANKSLSTAITGGIFKLYWYDLYPYLQSNTYIKNGSWAALLHKKAKSLRKGTALSKAKRCSKCLTIYHLFIPSHSTKRKPISYLLLFMSYYLISRNPIPIAHAPTQHIASASSRVMVITR